MSTGESVLTSQPETLQSAVTRLAMLSDLEYERQRKAEAKRLDIRLPQLDAEVNKVRAQTSRTSSPRGALMLPMHEPCSESVDGVELLNELVETLDAFLVLPPHASQAVALWIVHTHAFAAADIAPRLAFVSPEKRCGKTTALKVLNGLVQRALTTANLTPAVLFRIIEAAKPTLLIDEADTFLGDDKHELRGILNSGHEPENARVLRCTGEKFEPHTFSTWAPIAIATIRRLPDTLADRSIVIRMKRKLLTDPVRRFTRRDVPKLSILARKIARWAVDNVDSLRDAEPEVPEDLHDRAADNWRPLFAIADRAGGDWAKRARYAALSLSPADAVEDRSVSVMLLQDIRVVFQQTGSDKLSSKDICTRLSIIEHRPWADYGGGGPISQSQLAHLLDRYGIRPGTIRISEDTPKGYKLEQFDDAFSRYLPPGEPATTPQTHRESDSTADGTQRNGDATNSNQSPPDDVCGASVAVRG